jgi:hypothetical protein
MVEKARVKVMPRNAQQDSDQGALTVNPKHLAC